jgi:hypothetical protein
LYPSARSESKPNSPIDLDSIIVGTIDEVVSRFAEESKMGREAILKSTTDVTENAVSCSQVVVAIKPIIASFEGFPF